MTQLIQIADIQAAKPLSGNVNSPKKVDTFVLEAQDFDIRPILGDEFFADLLNDFPAFNKYDDLWNGSEYTCGDDTFTNPGLKLVLIYYSWARITSDANITSTSFGLVSKLNEDSTPISEKQLARIVSQGRSGAMAYQNRVVDFLVRTSDDFPLFKCVKNSGKSSGIRISPIRKR